MKFSPLLSAARDVIFTACHCCLRSAVKKSRFQQVAYNAACHMFPCCLSSQAHVPLLEAPCNLTIRREDVIFEEVHEGQKAKFLGVIENSTQSLLTIRLYSSRTRGS